MEIYDQGKTLKKKKHWKKKNIEKKKEETVFFFNTNLHSAKIIKS